MTTLQEYFLNHDKSTINDVIKDLTDYEKQYLHLHLQNTKLIRDKMNFDELDRQIFKANNKLMEPLFLKMDYEQRIRMGWIFEHKDDIKDWNNIL